MPEDRRLAAIMFTDIVGYTALMGESEKKAFETINSNRELHKRLVEKHHGRIVKELGDGLLTVFDNGTEAVLCAVDIQKAANEKNIPLRIGIHEGEIVFDNEDIFGDGVNIASRIQMEATTGGVCISDAVYRIIKNKENLKAESIGKKHLKNVKEPIHLFQLRIEGLQFRTFNSSKKVNWYFIPLAGILCLFAGYSINIILHKDTDTTLVNRLSINVNPEFPVAMIGETHFNAGQKAITISPNGQTLVYAGETKGTTRLYVRMIDSYESVPLSGTDGAYYPFFSPDGQWIAFFTKNQLKKVNVNGGDPLILCPVVHPYGGTWGEDDIIYFSNIEGRSLYKVPATGGTDLEILRNQDGIFWPFIMPDGRSILFNGGYTSGNIYSYSLIKRELTQFSFQGSNLRYVNTEHILYALRGRLMAIPFDNQNLTLNGSPIPIIDNVRTESGHNCAQYDISDNGLIVYLQGTTVDEGKLFFVGHDGMISHNLSLPPDFYGQFLLSPDNSKLLYEVYEDLSFWGVKTKIHDISSITSSNLLNESSAIWSTWASNDIIYFYNLSDSSIYWKEYNKTETHIFLKDISERYYAPVVVSKNGDFMVMGSFENNQQDLWSVSLKDTTDLKRLTDTPKVGEWGVSISPDNRLIAYTSEESGQYEIYVIPYPPDGQKWQVSSDGGLEPKWSPSGKELYYRSIDMKNMMAVPIKIDPVFTKGKSRVLWRADFLDVPGFSYDITNDGQYFLMKKSVVEEKTTTEINIITNFIEVIKGKATD